MSDENMEAAKDKLAEKRKGAAGAPAKSIEAAFVALQSEMVPVAKDRDNPFFKSNYATLLAIVGMLRPLLTKHGLAYTQGVVSHDGEMWMRTRIFGDGGASGGEIVSEVPFTCVDKKPQGLGSAITYMKRYGLQCAFGVVVAEDETDDDGNRANGNHKQKTDAQPW